MVELKLSSVTDTFPGVLLRALMIGVLTGAAIVAVHNVGLTAEREVLTEVVNGVALGILMITVGVLAAWAYHLSYGPTLTPSERARLNRTELRLDLVEVQINYIADALGRLDAILSHEAAERQGFWHGNVTELSSAEVEALKLEAESILRQLRELSERSEWK